MIPQVVVPYSRVSQPDASRIATLAAVFRALSNDHRLAILACIRTSSSPTSISTLTEQAGMTRFAVSRHLSVLRDAGLVAFRRHRQRKEHFIESAVFDRIDDWLLPFLD